MPTVCHPRNENLIWPWLLSTQASRSRNWLRNQKWPQKLTRCDSKPIQANKALRSELLKSPPILRHLLVMVLVGPEIILREQGGHSPQVRSKRSTQKMDRFRALQIWLEKPPPRLASWKEIQAILMMNLLPGSNQGKTVMQFLKWCIKGKKVSYKALLAGLGSQKIGRTCKRWLEVWVVRLLEVAWGRTFYSMLWKRLCSLEFLSKKGKVILEIYWVGSAVGHQEILLIFIGIASHYISQINQLSYGQKWNP